MAVAKKRKRTSEDLIRKNQGLKILDCSARQGDIYEVGSQGVE
jgi:hypothetical protein